MEVSGDVKKVAPQKWHLTFKGEEEEKLGGYSKLWEQHERGAGLGTLRASLENSRWRKHMDDWLFSIF